MPSEISMLIPMSEIYVRGIPLMACPISPWLFMVLLLFLMSQLSWCHIETEIRKFAVVAKWCTALMYRSSLA